ncbi:MAG: hypothetical protein AAFR27_00480, partial [Pseudomonadota bacterium]
MEKRFSDYIFQSFDLHGHGRGAFSHPFCRADKVAILSDGDKGTKQVDFDLHDFELLNLILLKFRLNKPVFPAKCKHQSLVPNQQSGEGNVCSGLSRDVCNRSGANQFGALAS